MAVTKLLVFSSVESVESSVSQLQALERAPLRQIMKIGKETA